MQIFTFLFSAFHILHVKIIGVIIYQVCAKVCNKISQCGK
jgi:hypothetical protein